MEATPWKGMSAYVVGTGVGGPATVGVHLSEVASDAVPEELEERRQLEDRLVARCDCWVRQCLENHCVEAEVRDVQTRRSPSTKRAWKTRLSVDETRFPRSTWPSDTQLVLLGLTGGRRWSRLE
jgi:hypothetical protein